MNGSLMVLEWHEREYTDKWIFIFYVHFNERGLLQLPDEPNSTFTEVQTYFSEILAIKVIFCQNMKLIVNGYVI